MKRVFNFGVGVKSACSEVFNLSNKFINYLKALRYYGTMTLRNVFQLFSHSTIKQNLFTVHRSPFTQTAFTLAETLIVIGIIGVVAALTLPNLNHATGDKETVTKVKKIYSSLTEAFDRAQAVYGDYDTWFINETSEAQMAEKLGKRVTEFMKISKECGLNTNQGCMTSTISTFLSGATNYNFDTQNTFYKVVTSDGMSLLFHLLPYSGNIKRAYILADIDGPNKGSNTVGKDLFYFYVDKNTNSLSMSRNCSSSPSSCVIFIYVGYDSTSWVLDNENMDYLKADMMSGKCNDNPSIILDGVNNTSCH